MSIKELPPATRPREKLLAHGAQALADVELLALLLRTGAGGLGVLQLAERLLGEFDGLAGLVYATPLALERSPGLGPAKRAELAAVLEISRRALLQQLKSAPVFDAPQKVNPFCGASGSVWGRLARALRLLPSGRCRLATRRVPVRA
jgi:DNA repair protein RadC